MTARRARGTEFAPAPVSRAREGGFTLIELLVTLAVMIVTLSIAVPALRDFTLRNQVAGARSALLASLAYARTEAARRGIAVHVIAAEGSPAGNEFANGWDVYAAPDADGTFGGAASPSLRHYDAPESALILHGARHITFDPSGYLTPAAAITFKVCQSVRATPGYLITLPPSGSADVSEFSVATPADCRN